MNTEESEFLYKTSCPNCGSSDANAVYSDGSNYCFSCEKYTVSHDKEVTYRRTRVKEFKPLQGEYGALKARGIHQSTCEAMGYFWSTYRDQRVQVANIRDAQGNLVGQKVRTKDKDFVALGKPQDVLFGMHRFKGGKKIVITEGEIDALSVSQVQDNKYPVVSIPNGASGRER